MVLTLHTQGRARVGDAQAHEVVEKSGRVTAMLHEAILDEPEPLLARPAGFLILIRELEHRLAVLVVDVRLEPATFIDIHNQNKLLTKLVPSNLLTPGNFPVAIGLVMTHLLSLACLSVQFSARACRFISAFASFWNAGKAFLASAMASRTMSEKYDP